MPPPGQVAADPTTEAIGAATPAAVAAAAVVPQPVHAIEVPRTVRAAPAVGQAVVAPRVPADADVALRAPAVEVVRVGRAAAAAAAAKPCNRSCNGESFSGSEGAPHYAAARAGGCRSRGGGDRGRNPTPAAVAAAPVVPQPVNAINVRCVGGEAGNRSSEGTSGRGRGSEGASR